MTRLSPASLFALACLATAAVGRPRLPSPTTWLRDKADLKLDASIREFFYQARQEDSDSADAEKLIKKLDNNRVQIGDDTLVSDYITVGSLLWDEPKNSVQEN